MKTTVEKKKTSSGARFNIFDAVLILLAVLCIVGIWQRNNLRRLFDSGEALETYTVTFEIKQMRSAAAELLTEGTELYLEDNDTRVSLGKLSGPFNAVPATVYLQNDKGETVKAVYPENGDERLQDGTGTLQCRGIEHDGVFMLEGKTYLAVNRTATAFSEKGDFEIRITGIQKTGEAG